MFYTWALFLILIPQQQAKPDIIALVFGPDPVRIEIVKTEEAEARYDKLKQDLKQNPHPTETDRKMLAALNLALGTMSDVERFKREYAAWEDRKAIERGEAPKPDKE